MPQVPLEGLGLVRWFPSRTTTANSHETQKSLGLLGLLRALAGRLQATCRALQGLADLQGVWPGFAHARPDCMEALDGKLARPVDARRNI